MLLFSPPFSLVGRVLQKVQEDEAEIALVAHYGQPKCGSKTLRMSVDYPMLLPSREDTLHLPQNPGAHHPLMKTAPNNLQSVRQALLSAESEQAAEIVMRSWRASTVVQYRSALGAMDRVLQ